MATPAQAPHAVWITAVAAAAALSCTPSSRSDQVKADVEAVRREQTPEKLLQRGRAFASIRDYTRAEQYLSAAMAAGAPPSAVLPLLLQVCIAENRYRAALLYAEPHLKAHPDEDRLRFVVASLYASIGETEMALSHLRQVVERRPDYAEVQYALAVLLRDSGRDPVGADAHFREYLRLEPHGAHAAEARGSLLKPVESAAPAPSAEDRADRARARGRDASPKPVRVP